MTLAPERRAHDIRPSSDAAEARHLLKPTAPHTEGTRHTVVGHRNPSTRLSVTSAEPRPQRPRPYFRRPCGRSWSLPPACSVPSPPTDRPWPR